MLPVRARLKDIAMWVVTGIDDIVVERTWRAWRRGDRALAVRTWRELVLGFPGCALPLLAGFVAFVAWAAWLLVRWAR